MTNSTLPPIIGFTGAAGSGKSAATVWVLKNHPASCRVTFAGPIKAMARELIGGALPRSWPRNAGDYVDDPVLKNEPMPFLGGITPRRIMQTLGTEWGRQVIHPDFWVGVAAAKVERAAGSTFRKSDRVPVKVVLDDVRFQNEALMVRAYGGVVVRVVRPGMAPAAEVAAHLSEAMDFEADITLVNDGTLEDLHAKVAALFPAPVKVDKKAKQ